jgi:glycosyltransferase involved in cell wall biosynthesis
MRSVSALVQQLGDQIEFRVISRDRDSGGGPSYPDVRSGEWKPVGKARVRYLAPREITSRGLAAVVSDIGPHAVYLNSFFAPMSLKLLIARRLGALKGIPVLLAPRGELSPGALRLKALKKRSYLQLSKWTGLHANVVFHASTDRESDEISGAIQLGHVPRVARNPVALDQASRPSLSKVSGAVRFVFLSRIARKKNLHLAIDLLRSLEGSVKLDIYGPVDDESYWRECRLLIDEMPTNVTITYHGAVDHDLVGSILSTHHYFIFPTASENFGHAMIEALLAGCPVITSDQTPWLGLSTRGAGWDLPLQNLDNWRRVLQQCVDMDTATYAQASLHSRAFGNQIVATDTVAENLELFRSISGSAS